MGRKNYFRITKTAGATKEVQEILNSMTLDTDEAKQEILAAFGQAACDIWKDETEARGFVDTGALKDSYVYEIKDDEVSAYPKGEDKKGVRNAEKAFILHYGKESISPSHYVDAARERTEDSLADIARKILAEKMKG